MVVDDVDDRDGGHLGKINATVRQARHRRVVRLEDESVRVNKVHRVVATHVPAKSVSPFRRG